MRKGLVINVLIAIIVIIAAASAGADAVKLKYALSVYLDETGASIKYPESVACSEKSDFIVADTGNNRLIMYTFEDRDLKGGSEIRLPELSYPITVQVNSRGEIFSLDGKRRRIVHLSREGVFKSYIEPKGVPSPALFVPRNFVIDKKDDIYILDILSGRVIVLDPTGAYKRIIDFPEKYGAISDLAVDPAGNTLIIDSTKASVYSASPEAKIFSPLSENLTEHAKFPTGITTDENGFIFLTDKNGGRIIILSPDGVFQGQLLSLGWTEGALYYPTSLCVSDNGYVFIADRNNSRVQIFSVDK
jgi:sugar lactone lactonase YvrE